jgi:AraC family transcriptional activator FtrA
LAEIKLSEQILPKLGKRPFNPLVVALAYDGLCIFEFSCVTEVFGLARPEAGSDWYRFETCSINARKVRGQYGMSMEVDAGLERLVQAGTIWIPGWQGIDVPVPPAIINALREAHRRGARLLSICSGSFVIAATGLLDGRRATTHWRCASALQRAYPKVQVDPNVLYVDEGQIMTSAGSAAGLDLCLHLVRRDYGPEMANHVARRLVIAPHRSGGQAQFLQRPIPKQERSSLALVLEKAQQSLAQPLRISRLAQMAAMSERTFMRRFRASTGMSPGDWITLQRVDRARELLESTELSIDHIAVQTGLGTATTLRHHFRRKVGVSPAEYRRRFSRQRSDLHLVG